MYVKEQTGLPVRPDPEDHDRSVAAEPEAEQAHQYRLAQARKLLRLYRRWQSGSQPGPHHEDVRSCPPHDSHRGSRIYSALAGGR
jgi:hypothetical protein